MPDPATTLEPDWSEVIPLTLDLPPGTAVTSKFLGKGFVIDTKPLRLGWPHDAYVRWFVFSEDREWKCSPRADVYLDLESPAGFAYGLRLLISSGRPVEAALNSTGAATFRFWLGKTSAADRLTLARALAEVTS